MVKNKRNRTKFAAFSAMALAAVLLASVAHEARAQDTPVTVNVVTYGPEESATTNRRDIFVILSFNRAFDPLDPATDNGLDFARVLDADGTDVTEHFTASSGNNRLLLGPEVLGFEILAGDGLEGEYRIMIRGSSFTFDGVPIADYVTDSFTIDTIVPTLTRVARQDPMRTYISSADTELTFRLTFSEIVAGLDAGDFDVTGSTATVSGINPVGGVLLDGTAFSATWDVTISGGNLASLAEGARVGLVPVVTPGFLGIGIGDRYNNNLSGTLPQGDDYETWIRGQLLAYPIIQRIERAFPTTELTNSTTLEWRVVFDPAFPVDTGVGSGFQLTDNFRLFFTDLDGAPISPANPPTILTASYRIGSGFQEAIVTTSGGSLSDHKIGLTLAHDHRITILSFRVQPPDHIETFTVDNVRPTMTIDAPAEFTDGDFLVTFTFSEPVDDFANLDIVLENASHDGVIGANPGTTYTILVRSTIQDFTAREDITINVGENTLHDLAGNGNRAATATVAYNEPMVTLILGSESIREDGVSVTLSATLEPVPMYITSVGEPLDLTEITVTLTPVGGAMMSDYRLSHLDTLFFPIGTGRLTVTNPLTIRSRDNDVDNPNRVINIEATAATRDGGKPVAIANELPLTLTIVDDDERGVDVSAADAGVTVAEDGGTATYTVALESEPTGEVSITVASDNMAAATVSPNALMFTPDNWDETQTVTVTGVNDDVDSADRSATIRHTASGADYAEVSVASVSVTVTDDDDRGVDVSAAETGVTVAEADGTADYTVVLESEPTDNVTITVASDDVAAATVSPGTLMFTSANWDMTQPVRVTGVNDDTDGDRAATIRHMVSGADYGEVLAANVTVTVSDDDPTPITASIAADATMPTEAGAVAGTFTVTLTPAVPAGANARIAYNMSGTATGGTDYTITASPLTITAGDAMGTITVTPMDDGLDDDAETVVVTLTGVTLTGADDHVGRVDSTANSAMLTITDDDDRGVDVSAAGTGVTVAEAGGTATYTVALASQPTDVVTIGVASDDVDAATVSPNALMFTPGNWDMTQTVTVTGVNDDVDSDRTTTIRHTASGADYASESVAGVPVTVTDDDDRGVDVSAAGTGVTVAEAGGTADYTVALASQPTGDVSITVASDNVAAATVSPNALMFTPANWDMTQPVTVTGVNDDVDSSDRSAMISHTVSGADYEGVSAAGVTVTVSDDDPTPITASMAAGNTPTEAGPVAGTFTVTLTPAVPAGASASIVYEVSGTATQGTDYTITASPLIIAEGDATGTITVTPMDDGLDDDAETVVVTLTGVTLMGADDYAGMVDGANTSATLTITDDDATPITASIAAGNTPTEAGPVAGTFTVTLTPAVPTGASARIAYNVSGTAAGGTDYTITASPLTIDADGTTGTITVTPMDDDLDDDAETVVVTLTGVTLTGADDHAGMVDSTANSAMLTITDDDGRGVDVSETEVTVAEAGGTADYTVALASQPTGDVAITVASDNMAAATVSPNALMFTPANWDTTQTVTVTGVNDDTNGDRTATIRHTVSGADYGGVSAASVTVTVSDDDPIPITARIAAGATTPTEVGAVAGTFTVTLNQAVPAGASISIMYDVSGTATQGTDYTITASPLIITAGRSTGAIMVTPVDDSPLQGDGETVVVTLTGAALTPADGYTAAVDVANASTTLTIAEDLRRMERRDRGISMALSTVGQIVGWDTTESIRRRLGSGGESGAPRLSGFPHSGLSPDSEPELTDFQDLLRDGVGVDVALNARSPERAAAGEVPLVQAWATASRSDFDNEPFAGRIQDGEGSVTRIGVDALYDSGWKVGVTVGMHNIEVDFDDRAVNTTGAQDLDLMVLNPYVSYSRDRRLVWGTVGIGNGDMNYREHSEGRIRRGSADLRLRGISGGFEYGLVTTGPLDLTGRGEAMAVRIDADASGASEVQFASRTDVYGARGEMEIGLSAITRGGLRVRPYALVGFRWDGGDLEDAVAAEYGGGIDVRGESFFVEASARSQLDSDDENVDVTAWGLSVGYDRDGDHRGLILDFSQNSGPSRYDPFDDGAGGVLPASAPAATAPLTATVRYGLGFRNGLLAPYHTRRYDGSAISSAETGVEYRVGVASWGLMHAYKPATDPDQGDSHSVNLTGRVNF